MHIVLHALMSYANTGSTVTSVYKIPGNPGLHHDLDANRTNYTNLQLDTHIKKEV